MSNKNLLNESQIRQFMKLAKLEPLTPGFVEGLTESTEEELEEVRSAADGGGLQDARRGHGRGRGPADRLEEADEEAELHATEDELGDMDAEADREGDEIDDLEDELDAADDADAAEGRMISVDDFLAALEGALESAMGEEVEISDESGDEDEVEADVEMDAEMDMGGEDVDVDMDAEEMLQEKAYTAKKEKPGADKRKGAEKRGAEGTLAKTKGHGRVDYVNEEEGSKKGEYRRKDKDGKVGHRAGEGKDGHYKDYEGPAGGNKGDESKTDPGHKDYMKESAATDELVEQITKRVAARILKSALKKKVDVNENMLGDLGRMAKKGFKRATGVSAKDYVLSTWQDGVLPHLKKIGKLVSSQEGGFTATQLMQAKKDYMENNLHKDAGSLGGTQNPKKEAVLIADQLLYDADDTAGRRALHRNYAKDLD